MIREAQVGPRGPAGGGLKNEGRGVLSTPKLAMPSPQTTLRQKEPGIPRMSHCVVLKTLLPQGEKEAQSDTKNPPAKGEVEFPSL